MSRRKVKNRRSQRYRRVSTDSAILDRNDILSDEEPFWWTRLEENPGRRATQFNFLNETSPQLDPSMKLRSTPPTNNWWKVLETPNASVRSVPKTPNVKTSTITQTQVDSTTSDSETNQPIIRKKKLCLHTKLKKNHESNPFLKVLNASTESATSEPIQSTSRTLTSSNMQSENLHKSNRKRLYDQENSLSESPPSERIMKARPKIFGKQKLSASTNIFDDILQEAPSVNSSKIASKLSEANASSISAKEKSNMLEKNNTSSDTIVYSPRSITSNLSFATTEHNSGKAPIPNAQSTMIESTPVRQHILSNKDIQRSAVNDSQSELDNRPPQKSASNVAGVLPLLTDKSNISLASKRKKSLAKGESNVSLRSTDYTGDSTMSPNKQEAALKPKSRFLNAWRKTEKDILDDTEPESNKTNRNQQRSTDTNLGINVFADELNQSRDNNNKEPSRKESTIFGGNDSHSDVGMSTRRKNRSNIDRISASQGTNIDFEPDTSIHSRQSRHSIVKDHPAPTRRTRSSINVTISPRRSTTKEQQNKSKKIIVNYSDTTDDNDQTLKHTRKRSSARSTNNKETSRVTPNNSTSNLEPPVSTNSTNTTAESNQNATLHKSMSGKHTSKRIVNTPPSITSHTQNVSPPVISTPVSVKQKRKFRIVDESDGEITDTETQRKMSKSKSFEHESLSNASTLKTSSRRESAISKKNETLKGLPRNRSTVDPPKSIVNDLISATSSRISYVIDSDDSEDEEIILRTTRNDTSKDTLQPKHHSLVSNASSARSFPLHSSDIGDDQVSNTSRSKNMHKNQSHSSSNGTLGKKQTPDKTMTRDASKQTNTRLATVEDENDTSFRKSHIIDSDDSEDEEIILRTTRNNETKNTLQPKHHSLVSSASRARSLPVDNSDIEDNQVSNTSRSKNMHKNQSHGSLNGTLGKKQTPDKTMNRDASKQTNTRLTTVEETAYSDEDNQDLVLQIREKAEDKQEARNTAHKDTVKQTRRSFLSSTRKSTVANQSSTVRLSGSISPVASERNTDIRRQVLKRNTRSSKQSKLVRRSSRNTSAAQTSRVDHLDDNAEHAKLDRRENELPRRSTRSARVIEEKEADEEYTSPQREDSNSPPKQVTEEALNTTPQNLSLNRDSERLEDSSHRDASFTTPKRGFSKSKRTDHSSIKVARKSLKLNKQPEKPSEESMKSPMQLSSTPLSALPKPKHRTKKSSVLSRKSIHKTTSEEVTAGKQRNIMEFLKTKPEFGLSSILSNPQTASQVTASQVLSNPDLMNEVKKEIANIVKEQEKMDTETEKPTLLSKIASMKVTPKNRKVTKPAKPVDRAYLVGGKVYKAPKLIRPKPWVTDRLYRFLWKCLKPRYDLSTRVKSEKFIQQLADVVTVVTQRKSYKSYEKELNSLMEKMARINIIKNRNDFYHFCHDYLPYEFRIKAIPMILPGNKYNIPYDPDTLLTPLLESPR